MALHSLKVSMAVGSAASAKTYFRMALESSMRAFSVADNLERKVVATKVATLAAYSFELLEREQYDLASRREAKAAA